MGNETTFVINVFPAPAGDFAVYLDAACTIPMPAHMDWGDLLWGAKFCSKSYNLWIKNEANIPALIRIAQSSTDFSTVGLASDEPLAVGEVRACPNVQIEWTGKRPAGGQFTGTFRVTRL